MRPTIFFGIENEFELWRRENKVSFKDEWEDLFESYPNPAFKKTSFCIRTHTGGSIYADGAEPEACTAPVLVQPGFATQVGDALYIARKDLVDFIKSDPTLALTGYSMHWNVTRPQVEPITQIRHAGYSAFAGVPFSMFALTPNSVGSNLRTKEPRREFLGDHLPGEEQAIAFALFYTAIIHSLGRHIDAWPYAVVAMEGTTREYLRNRVTHGRESNIVVVADPKANGVGSAPMWHQRNFSTRTVTAQEYLEKVYAIVKGDVAELGTPEEIALLEAFISGKRELEIDKKTRYERMRVHKNKLGYRPAPVTKFDMAAYAQERKTPGSLGELLGAFAHQWMPRLAPARMEVYPRVVQELGWDVIMFKNRSPNSITATNTLMIAGTDTLQLIAEATKGLDMQKRHSLIEKIAFELLKESANVNSIGRWYTTLKSFSTPQTDDAATQIAARVGSNLGRISYFLERRIATEPDKPAVTTLSPSGIAFVEAFERIYLAPHETLSAAEIERREQGIMPKMLELQHVATQGIDVFSTSGMPPMPAEGTAELLRALDNSMLERLGLEISTLEHRLSDYTMYCGNHRATTGTARAGEENEATPRNRPDQRYTNIFREYHNDITNLDRLYRNDSLLFRNDLFNERVTTRREDATSRRENSIIRERTEYNIDFIQDTLSSYINDNTHITERRLRDEEETRRRDQELIRRWREQQQETRRREQELSRRWREQEEEFDRQRERFRRNRDGRVANTSTEAPNLEQILSRHQNSPPQTATRRSQREPTNNEPGRTTINRNYITGIISRLFDSELMRGMYATPYITYNDDMEPTRTTIRNPTTIDMPPQTYSCVDRSITPDDSVTIDTRVDTTIEQIPTEPSNPATNEGRNDGTTPHPADGQSNENQ